MIVLLFLLAIALWLGVVAFDAYILMTHVPTLIADPSNFGAWFWIIFALSLTGLGASQSSRK